MAHIYALVSTQNVLHRLHNSGPLFLSKWLRRSFNLIVLAAGKRCHR